MNNKVDMLKEFFKYKSGEVPDNVRWLITQAEWADSYSIKTANLNEFLQDRVTGRFGDNVIDIAMDYIRQLEKEINSNN